jgi:hypothetical protein
MNAVAKSKAAAIVLASVARASVVDGIRIFPEIRGLMGSPAL